MGGARWKVFFNQHSRCADILEYILAKLAARIVAKASTLPVKVKTHRGEPLNEGADDLAEVGLTLEREGENYRWKERTTRVVYTYYDRNSCQWKKVHGVKLFGTHQGEGRRNL